MFNNAKNCNIIIDNSDIDYISFGNGQKNLVMIPGLGDGLRTVKGTAFALAVMYKIFAKEYRVYVFSRKNKLEDDYTTRAMANDLAKSMKQLGIDKASILGVSQGGMIAQYLAIDYPEMVEKLVLAVTTASTNTTINKVVGNWIEMAMHNDYKALFIDIAEKSYSEAKLKQYRFLYPLLSRIGKPKDFNRFIIQAKACLNHNSYDELNKIQCKTLVLGGDNDKVVGNSSSIVIAEKLKNSKLIIYKGLGHAAYEEAKDFNNEILSFLNSL